MPKKISPRQLSIAIAGKKKKTDGVFGYCLYYWNWKIITKSTVNKNIS